jgi:hypothetical protein
MSRSKQGSLEPERYSRTRAVRNRRPKDPHNPSQKSLHDGTTRAALSSEAMLDARTLERKKAR